MRKEISNDFNTRVNYAIAYIKRSPLQRRSERNFDSCFEIYDSDYVAVAIMRRALRNDKLSNALVKFLSVDCWNEWVDISKKFSHLSNKELKIEADNLRAKKIAESEERDRNYNEQMEKARILRESGTCKHPAARVYFWFAWNCETGKTDIPCAACCDCGEVLLGGVE
jgi:hypothetical protein